jgi:hypothetical protein
MVLGETHYIQYNGFDRIVTTYAHRDPLIKAKHFQGRAQARLQLAECAHSSNNRRHHLTLARHYLLMGEAEIEEASKLLARRLHRSKKRSAAEAA